MSTVCRRLQNFPEDNQIVPRLVEIVDNGLIAIAARLVESPGGLVLRASRRLHEKQPAVPQGDPRLDFPHQSATDSTALRRRVYGNPVQIEHAVRERVGAVADISEHVVAVAVHQKEVLAGLAALTILVPKFLDAGGLRRFEDARPLRDGQNRFAVFRLCYLYHMRLCAPGRFPGF